VLALLAVVGPVAMPGPSPSLVPHAAGKALAGPLAELPSSPVTEHQANRDFATRAEATDAQSALKGATARLPGVRSCKVTREAVRRSTS